MSRGWQPRPRGGGVLPPTVPLGAVGAVRPGAQVSRPRTCGVRGRLVRLRRAGGVYSQVIELSVWWTSMLPGGGRWSGSLMSTMTFS